MSQFDKLYLTVASYGRSTTIMVPTRHEQHHYQGPLHQFAANAWADKLSRHLDSDDKRLDPVLFAELDARFGKHSIDHFASALNTFLPRYNAG
jgi:hypothetical protein